jgi:hypothetical protein
MVGGLAEKPKAYVCHLDSEGSNLFVFPFTRPIINLAFHSCVPHPLLADFVKIDGNLIAVRANFLAARSWGFFIPQITQAGLGIYFLPCSATKGSNGSR